MKINVTQPVTQPGVPVTPRLRASATPLLAYRREASITAAQSPSRSNFCALVLMPYPIVTTFQRDHVIRAAVTLQQNSNDKRNDGKENNQPTQLVPDFSGIEEPLTPLDKAFCRGRHISQSFFFTGALEAER